MKRLIAAAVFTALMAGTALADTTLKLVEVITSPPRTEFLEKQIAEFDAVRDASRRRSANTFSA